MRKNWPLYLYLIGWSGYFLAFWLRVIRLDEQGNLLVGQSNMWADWAWHLTLSHAIAERGWLLSESPLLAGSSLSYPFLSSLLSAVLIRLNLPAHWALVLPSLLFSLLLILALYYFFLTLLKRQSIAIIGACLFLFNGGLGFVHFFEAMAQVQAPLEISKAPLEISKAPLEFLKAPLEISKAALELLSAPPQQYTSLPEQNIVWISIVNSMVIPQRSLTMGLPLTLLALAWIYQLAFSSQGEVRLRRTKWGSAVLILGMMPVIHAHSFLAAFVILASWCLFDIASQRQLWLARLKLWLPIALAVGGVALPLIGLFLLGNASESFVRWHPGWYAREEDINWLWFWLNNWSLTPVLALIATAVLAIRRGVDALRDWLPFWLLFAAVNLWIFQPWIWDNTKLLVWAAVGLSALAAQCLYGLWNKVWFSCYQNVQQSVSRCFACGLLVVCCLSGALDVYRNGRLSLHTYTLYTSEELALAQWARQHTSVKSRWLISDRHNHWALNLTGRQVLMGYSGWLWSHGYDYAEAASTANRIYSRAERSLLDENQLDYVVLGPHTRRKYPNAEHLFNSKLERVHATANYQIFKHPLTR